MPTNSPKLSQIQAKKILEVDLINLARKVSNGKTLTPHERKLVEAYTGPDESASEPTFAPSQSALADILGCTRQVIAYHCKRPGSPGRTADGRYNVADWRAYLKLIGRVTIDDGDPAAPQFVNGRPQIRADFGDGCYSAVGAVGGTVLPALKGSLKASGVKLSGKVRDRIAFHLWSILARAIDQCATHLGFESYFEPDSETGEVFYPEAITEMAARITGPTQKGALKA